MSDRLDRRTFVGAVLALGAMTALGPSRAYAVTSAQKKAEIEQVQSKLDSLSSEVEQAAEGYNAARIKYNAATQKVSACQKKISAAEAKIGKLQGHLNTRATSMYRSGSMSYLDVLMGVGSFDDFATVWDTLNNLNEDDADLVSQTKVTKAELESAKKELVDNQNEAQQQLASARAHKQTVESKQAEYQATYNSLSAEYKRLVKREQAAKEAAEARAAKAYTPSASSSSSGSSSSGSGSSGGGSSSGGSSSSGSGGSGGGSSAVSRARACLGLPYVWGAAGPGGYDCSGLVSYALTGQHTHQWVASSFWALPTVSNPRPGDVVACSDHHCGLYIGGGQMIEAPHSGAVVRISAVRGKIVRP